MITRVNLENGDWIDVKSVLKIGDKAHINSYASDGISADRQTFNYNIVRHQIATAAVRILNWSLKPADEKLPATVYPSGKPFHERADVIASLGEDEFETLYKAVETFEAGLKPEKNAQTDGVSA